MPGDPTAATPPPQHVHVGRLGRAYQLEGGLRLRLDAGASADAVAAAGRVFVTGFGPAAVRELRTHAGEPILYLEGVRDRSSARALTGREVYAPATATAASGPAPELVGAEVRCQGRLVGRVREVRPARGNTLLVVDADAGELLLPLTAPYVRVEEGEVRLVDPPAGLVAP